MDREANNRTAPLERAARDLRDIEIVNRVAERLNREAMDTVYYQQYP